jgi:RND family efflux transporter MFP subunit
MRLPVRFLAGVAFGILAGVLAAVTVMGGKDKAPDGARGPGGGPSAMAGGAGGGGRPGGGGPAMFGRGMAPAVSIATVKPAAIGRTIDAIGVARSAQSVTLAAETTGAVVAVMFKPGDQVKKGDPLLRLDDEAQRIDLSRAQAQYPIAKQNRDRFAELLKQDAASRVEADQALNAWRAAEADLAAARYALSLRTITAPFSGVVGLTTLERGDYVRAGDTIATIDDDSSLIIEFTAPQEAAKDLKLGQKVTVRLAAPGAQPIEGVISAIDSRVDQASRTLRVEAAFEASKAQILPGAVYAVTTTSEGAEALSLPGLAAQWDRNGSYVWRLKEDGAVERVSIRIAERRDQEVLVEGPLASGDRVIVEGADRVRPGMNFGGGEGARRPNGASPGGGAAGAAAQ